MRHARLPSAATKAAGYRGDQANPLLAPPVRLTLAAVVAINLGRLLVLLARSVRRHPVVCAVLVVLVVTWLLVGPAWLATGLGVAGVLLGVWALVHRATFARLIWAPSLTGCRVWWRYRRVWSTVLSASGLTIQRDGSEFVPRLRKARRNAYADQLLVGLLAGQSPADWEKRTEALAHAFRALSCRVRVHRPGEVWLDLAYTDALNVPVAALAIGGEPDLTALPLGRQEDGTPWLLRLLGCHVLIGGATGSGKGSVLWSLIRALAGGISTGVVRVWAIDPKGGMELAPGSGLFDRLAYRTTDDMLRLLEDAVAVMRDRQTRLLGVTRLHTPTTEHPLIVVVVDELAALVAYTDRDTKRRAGEQLQLLLSQGRAVGVLAVAALQDPSKDVLPFRDLFPTRIALRLVEDVQVDMILGRGARERGAACDRIPSDLPGVGYVQLDGVREPVRVRAAWVTDEDIATMSAARVEELVNGARRAVLEAGVEDRS